MRFGYASRPEEFVQINADNIRRLWPKRNDRRPNIRRLHRATIRVAIKAIRSEK